MKQQSKQKFHSSQKVSEMAGIIEKFQGGENLCMLSAMFNAMDKKQQDIITVSFILLDCQ
jgi:hypothetical protein